MTQRPRQIALPLTPAVHTDAASTWAGPCTAHARAVLTAWRTWPRHAAVLIAPADMGKTHFARVWAEEVEADLCGPGDRLDAAAGPIVLDDVDRAGFDHAAVCARLDAAAAGEAGAVLVTARSEPADWPGALPDLVSRAQALATAHINPPDRDEMTAMFIHFFTLRGLDAPHAALDGLTARAPRSTGAAVRLTAALDARALADRTSVTRRLVDEVLNDDADNQTPCS